MDGRTDRGAPAAHRGSVAHALRQWRGGARLIEHPALAGDRAAHEEAVAAVLAALGPFATVADLAARYVRERAAIDRGAAAACERAAPGRDLLGGAAADAAFWRRCRELVDTAVR